MIRFVASEVLFFVQKNSEWCHGCLKLIRFGGFVVELHMHTNVYAVYACGCSLSVVAWNFDLNYYSRDRQGFPKYLEN